MASKILKGANLKSVTNIWGTGTQTPLKAKEGMLDKWAKYWKNVLIDYQETVTESYQEAREKPKKFIRNISGLLFLLYCGITNPTETDFYDQVTKHANELALIGDSQRNPASENRLFIIQKLSDEGLLHRFSIGIASIIWISNFEKTSGLYAAHCDYLQPKALNFQQRVLDVGCFGKWWILERDMQDYDINPHQFY